MRLFIIRHADPDYPNNTITAAGHLEAQALAVRMAKLGLDRLYTSPLGRAMDTARYTADALGLTAEVQPWTAELGWAIEQADTGTTMAWDVHGHLVHQSPAVWTVSNALEHPPFDNPKFREGFIHIQQNSDAFLAELGYVRDGGVYRIVRGHREKIAVFCHGGFGLTWLAHLLRVPLTVMWAGFFLPPSSVTTILFDERNTEFATPRCLGMGDISHLYAAGLPMQPAGIKKNVD